MTHYANSQGQPLIAHLQSVATNAQVITNALFTDFDESLKNKIVAGSYASGLTHDLGKIDPSFQRYIAELNGDSHYQPEVGELYASNNPLHHEISLVLLNYLFKLKIELFDDTKFIGRDSIRDLKQAIRYSVYWHHPEPKREHVNLSECLKNYFENDRDLIQQMLNNFSTVLTGLFNVNQELNVDDFLDSMDDTQALPFFDTPKPLVSNNLLQKNQNDFQASLDQNVIRHLTRFALISADRYVSSLPVSEMMNVYKHESFNDAKLLDAIQTYQDLPELAGERTKLQLNAAEELNYNDITVCQGAAGSGKTRVSLLAYLMARKVNKSTHRGILWVCPRVAVGLGLLDELQESLPTATIGILTGEHKGVWKAGVSYDTDDIYDADIVITTVDQVARSLTSHGSIINFQHFIERYVVFDEYHELFSIQSLYYVTAILIRVKELQQYGHILISATPEPLHISLISTRKGNWKYPVTLPSFNEQPVMLSFSIEERDLSTKSCAYIFNTATMAQDSAVTAWLAGNNDIMCYHSKFTPLDKVTLTQDVLSRFGKNSLFPDSTLYAGPIAQAALNISRPNLNIDCSSPANTLQRLGRSNRFAEFGKSNIIIQCDTTHVLYGKVKNTGAQKMKLKHDKMQPLWEHYYSQYAFEFYTALLTHLGIKRGRIGKETYNCQSTLNVLSAFYHDFIVNQIESDGVLVNETYEFINDAVDYLKTYDLYKPVRQTIVVESDRQVMVSFRGESLWGTMHHVCKTNNKTSISTLTGLPLDNENLVSLSSTDVIDIPLYDYLKQSNHIEFKGLQTSIKYRAKKSGKRIDDHLQYLSRSQKYPLICSTEQFSNTPSLYYIHAINDFEESLTVGFRPYKKGIQK